jgi:hypothetical protein
MPERAPARTGSAPTAQTGGLVHADTAAKWLIISSIVYFILLGIVAIVIAAKFVWPTLLGTVAALGYGRLRPLHVNGMLFGWLLAADMGLAFYIVPRLCGVRLWGERLGVATVALWNIIVLGAFVALMAGWNQGLEYAELPLALDVLGEDQDRGVGRSGLLQHRHDVHTASLFRLAGDDLVGLLQRNPVLSHAGREHCFAHSERTLLRQFLVLFRTARLGGDFAHPFLNLT